MVQMFPRQKRQLRTSLIMMSLIGSFFIPHLAQAACAGTPMAVSEWNHMFDGTELDLSGCLIRVSDPVADEDGVTTLPLSSTPIPDTPAGWTPPVPPAVQPTPPSTQATQQGYRIQGALPVVYYSAPLEACHAWTQKHSCYYGPCSGVTWEQNQVYATEGSCKATNHLGTTFAITILDSTCPAGYTKSGSTCDLSNPTVVTKPADGKCNVIRSGNTFSGDPRDPDCDSQSFIDNKILIDGSQVKVNREPSLTIKANTDGSTTISTTTINNTNNTTTISTANYGTDGIQTGRKTETFNGVGAMQNSVSNNQPFDVSSLNKEATQAAIKTTLDNIKDKLEAPTDTNLQTQKDAFNTAADAHKAKIQEIGDNGLDAHGVSWSWFPEIPSATCAPITYGVSDHIFTWDICPTVDKVRDLAGFAFYVITAFGLYSILTGRKET
jgi:hypothetical protein